MRKFDCSSDIVFTRPGGNVTGVFAVFGGLVGKRIGLLRDVLPRATTIAVLAVPSSSTEALAREKDAQKAARLLGLQIKFLIAGGGRTLKTIDCRLSRPASSAVR